MLKSFISLSCKNPLGMGHFLSKNITHLIPTPQQSTHPTTCDLQPLLEPTIQTIHFHVKVMRKQSEVMNGFTIKLLLT